MKISDNPGKYLLDVWVNLHKFTLEFDTGAGETLIIKSDWQKMGSRPLKPSKFKFSLYRSRNLLVFGCATGRVKVLSYRCLNLKFFVVDSVASVSYCTTLNINVQHNEQNNWSTLYNSHSTSK